MELSEVLSAKQVCTELQSNQRDQAVHELLDLLVENGNLAEEYVEPLLRAIIKRETLGTTAIGRGIAVPHARLEGVGETSMAVGLSSEGVEFHALDGQPVRAVFLVVGCENTPDDYIKAMKQVSELVQTEDFRRFLFDVEGSEEVVDLVVEMAGR